MDTKAATDALLAALNIAPEIPEGTGFTVKDVMEDQDIGCDAARRVIERGVGKKIIHAIGIRRNSNGAKVYEMVGKRKK